MEEAISASNETLDAASMAEQIVDQFEDAFMRLTEEGTALLKASREKENKTADNRPTNGFMAKYYTMRQERYEPYENLLSQLTSMQEEEQTVKNFLEDTVSVQMAPTIRALLSKLDNIINGEMQPHAAYLQAPSPQPRREESPEPRNASFERNRLSLHTESQEIRREPKQ